MQDLIAVYTTVATREDARRIAHHAVEQRLAACAQISEIESHYRWQGAVVREPEYRVLLKTTAARYAEVERAILSLHPYTLPAIHAVPIAAASPPYATWIRENSTDASDAPD